MIRIDYFLFGYVTFSIPKESISVFAARLMRYGLSAKISSDGIFNVAYSKKRQFSELLADIEYTVSEPKGLFGEIYKLKNRYGIIAAVVLSLFLLFFSRTLVWDVRIDGISEEDKEELVSVLADSGLSVGSYWKGVRKAEVEARALLSSDDVAWLNINRRGTVAYVTAVPKTVVNTDDKTGVYCNIVAERDCVIEKITVKRGVALVKVGETVKAGDVLISGVIPTELGGGVCYAEGSVFGRFSEAVAQFSPSSVTEKVYSRQAVAGVSVRIFKKDINIFKSYGNLSGSCDIIEKKKQLTLFGVALPISVFTAERAEYSERELSVDEGALVKETAEKLSVAIARRTADLELISIKTSGEFKDDGYLMRAELIVSGEVAKVQEFYRE